MWNPSPESDPDSTNSSFNPTSTRRASKDDTEFTFIGIKKPRYEVEEEKNSCSEGHPHPLVNAGTSSPNFKDDTTILDIRSEEKFNSCSEDYPSQSVKSSTSSLGGAQTSIDDPDVIILDSEEIHPFSECHPQPSVSGTSRFSNAPSINDDSDTFPCEDSNDGDDDDVVIQACPQCYEEFWDKATFNFHIRTHDKSPKCLPCGKECDDKASYYSHVCDKTPTQTSDEQDSEDDFVEIQCYYCGKEFNDQESYNSHSKTHESDESPTHSSDE